MISWYWLIAAVFAGAIVGVFTMALVSMGRTTA